MRFGRAGGRRTALTGILGQEIDPPSAFGGISFSTGWILGDQLLRKLDQSHWLQA